MFRIGFESYFAYGRRDLYPVHFIDDLYLFFDSYVIIKIKKVKI